MPPLAARCRSHSVVLIILHGASAAASCLSSKAPGDRREETRGAVPGVSVDVPDGGDGAFDAADSSEDAFASSKVTSARRLSNTSDARPTTMLRSASIRFDDDSTAENTRSMPST